jgi:hypothetical protein
LRISPRGSADGFSLPFSAGTADQILAAKEKERAKEEKGKRRDVSPDKKRRRR